MKSTAKKIAMGGVLAALAIVFGYVEHLIPFNLGIYGLKLGLSNLVTVTALYMMGAKTALAVNFLRITVSSLLFGSTVSLAYSLCGGMLSLAVMILIKELDRGQRISAVGVSLCGGVTHNIGQLAVAVILVDNLKIAFYLPVLMAVGAITGFVIGSVAMLLINNKTLKNYFDRAA